MSNDFRERQEGLSEKENLKVKLAYKTPRAQRRAEFKAMQACPNSPSKFKAVVAGLGRRVENLLTVKCLNNIYGHGLSLSENTIKLVNEFYKRPDIVYTMPGMKDEMIVRENGKKVKMRKLYLTVFIKEAYAIFKEENPSIEISLDSFRKLRPKNVLLLKDTPMDQCKCRLHENFFFMVKALGVSMDKLWEDVLCENESKKLDGKCWKGDCDTCGRGKKFDRSLVVDDDSEVFWKVWEKTESGQIRVNAMNGTKGDLKEKCIQKLPEFQEHVRIKRIQSDAFNSDKKDADSSTLQCDFAMAYSSEYQNEIQSALWSRASINLFTAVFNHGDDTTAKPFLVVTDCKHKDKDAVYTFILKLIEKELANIKDNLVIFTDGPSSEFKNRFMTKFVTDIKALTSKAVVKWKYFATSHGKGSVDGIGGRAKSLVRYATKSQKSGGCVVQNSTEFYNLVKKLMPGVVVMHVSKEEIVNIVEERKPWENAKSVPGIMKVHSIVCEKDGLVELFTDDLNKSVLATVNYGASASESE